ncbi:MAG: PHD/YefM family antitoxin component YafN of YafNO toxin-antitoxin module [Arenicella sp.]|jgi:PHD/YefM family antitoxin component YafN of YafNO toxin-antitoxin module
MQKIDYLEAQSKLAKTMRQVCKEDTPVTINGAGKDQVVMMPLDTFLKLHSSHGEALECTPFNCHHST